MSRFKYECRFCESTSGLFAYYVGTTNPPETHIVCHDCADTNGYEKPPRVRRGMDGGLIEVDDHEE